MRVTIDHARARRGPAATLLSQPTRRKKWNLDGVDGCHRCRYKTWQPKGPSCCRTTLTGSVSSLSRPKCRLMRGFVLMMRRGGMGEEMEESWGKKGKPEMGRRRGG